MNENNQNGRLSEEELSRRLREKRVNNFSLNISDDEWEEDNNYEESSSLNSYSDPSVAERQSEQEAKSEKQAKKRAMQAHKARNKQKRKGNRRFFRILWLVMVLLIAFFGRLLCGKRNQRYAGCWSGIHQRDGRSAG